MPFFSIILPTYNRASFLKRSIGSVLAQTYTDWELIVIDDGSRDHTKEVVTSFKDPRIHYFYQENAERSAARNNGIARAKGEYICFLDSDDEYLPDYLMVLNQFIMGNSIHEGFIVCGLGFDSTEIHHKKPLLVETNSLVVEIANQFILPTQSCLSMSILQRENFHESYRIWEDTHLWLRIVAQFPFYQLSEYLVVQHRHASGTVREEFNRVQWRTVMQYLDAIKNLEKQYGYLFQGQIASSFFDDYARDKIKMFLYRSRQNRQLGLAMRLCFFGWIRYRSVYFIAEFPKILLNYLNIGLHDN